jgi:hypothetical protein
MFLMYLQALPVQMFLMFLPHQIVLKFLKIL